VVGNSGRIVVYAAFESRRLSEPTASLAGFVYWIVLAEGSASWSKPARAFM
jgi:hypothetical protein